MHVLLLTSAYKNKFNPINALFFYDQARALLNNRFKVGVICPMPITFVNILKSKLEEQQSREFKKNLTIFSFCVFLLGAIGVYLSL